MDRNRVREFFHQSREWARAKRGLELFQRAAKDLADCASIDSGFFVYRRRIFTNGVTPQQALVYAPWGNFKTEGESLQALVDNVIPRISVLDPIQERWLSVDAVSEKSQRQWARYGIRSFGIWPLMSREQRVGALAVARTGPVEGISDAATTALLDGCAAQLSLALDLILATRIAEDASQRDWLTGLWNRRGLEARFDTFVETAQKTGKPVVIGLIDLDNLKLINDQGGHPAGDAALRRVAQILTKQVRDHDLVVRWGGDEFVVVTHSMEATPGVMVRLQDAVRAEGPGFSISVGSALWGIDGSTWDQCYAVADRKLYDAKRHRGTRSGLPKVFMGGSDRSN